MIIVTADQMQAIDRQTIEDFGIPGRVLMENAGRGATRCFLQRIYSQGAGTVGLLAGRGNNGGDGFVMARYLAQRGVDVTVFLLSETSRVRGDAAANLALLQPLAVPVIEMPDLPLFVSHHPRMRPMAFWIDALLGTGLKDEVRGYYNEAIAFVKDQCRPVLAVDIPSGLNADTGQPCGICLPADVTVTFGSPKIGQMVEPGATLCGRLEIIDIGIPPMITETIAPSVRLITGCQVAGMLPRRAADAHKGQTGHALVIAGSRGKTGAAIMTTLSALRIGAGLVTLGAAGSLNGVLASMSIEAMTLPLPDRDDELLLPDALETIRSAARDKQCIAVGPGLGTSAVTGELVGALVAGIDLPLVIDADGLNLMVGKQALFANRQAPTILTPHPGEMARLCGVSTAQIQQDRVGAARSLARRDRVYVVLKGARTVVAEPDGRVWINTTGNSGMASGGMGDVLTGAIAGLIAQGCAAGEAAQAGVYLHGLAADLLAEETPRGYLATEVLARLPLALDRVLTDPPPLPVCSPLL